jgi:hypothetical protein
MQKWIRCKCCDDYVGGGNDDGDDDDYDDYDEQQEGRISEKRYF